MKRFTGSFSFVAGMALFMLVVMFSGCDKDETVLKVLNEIKKSRRVYKIGTLDVSETTGSQYWSPENPLSFAKIEDYAEKYGLPVERLQGDDKFVIIGEIGIDELLITRPAVPYGGSFGGGIEVVTRYGAVGLKYIMKFVLILRGIISMLILIT
jgi:hypothetical protein